jgi:putative exosortase-associated protein (TIGR04073 family)
VKKFITFSLMLVVACAAVPAFADSSEQVKNVQSGTRNLGTGWVEVMDNAHNEAAKGKGAGEHVTGVVAGGAIGVRRAIHRAGAGAIDLLTFWIPKKQPLVNPEAPRLQ